MATKKKEMKEEKGSKKAAGGKKVGKDLKMLFGKGKK